MFTFSKTRHEHVILGCGVRCRGVRFSCACFPLLQWRASTRNLPPLFQGRCTQSPKTSVERSNCKDLTLIFCCCCCCCYFGCSRTYLSDPRREISIDSYCWPVFGVTISVARPWSLCIIHVESERGVAKPTALISNECEYGASRNQLAPSMVAPNPTLTRRNSQVIQIDLVASAASVNGAYVSLMVPVFLSTMYDIWEAPSCFPVKNYTISIFNSKLCDFTHMLKCIHVSLCILECM